MRIAIALAVLILLNHTFAQSKPGDDTLVRNFVRESFRVVGVEEIACPLSLYEQSRWPNVTVCGSLDMTYHDFRDAWDRFLERRDSEAVSPTSRLDWFVDVRNGITNATGLYRFAQSDLGLMVVEADGSMVLVVSYVMDDDKALAQELMIEQARGNASPILETKKRELAQRYAPEVIALVHNYFEAAVTDCNSIRPPKIEGYGTPICGSVAQSFRQIDARWKEFLLSVSVSSYALLFQFSVVGDLRSPDVLEATWSTTETGASTTFDFDGFKYMLRFKSDGNEADRLLVVYPPSFE